MIKSLFLIIVCLTIQLATSNRNQNVIVTNITFDNANEEIIVNKGDLLIFKGIVG